MHSILAIDPCAERSVSDTGWAFGLWDDDMPLEFTAGGVISGGFDGFVAATQTVQEEDGWFYDDYLMAAGVVVCEHYVQYNKLGDATPLLTEGVVRYLRPDTVLQPSSGKNTLVSDTDLRRYGVYGTEGHHHDQREATRHALVYLAKQRHVPTLRKLKG